MAAEVGRRYGCGPPGTDGVLERRKGGQAGGGWEGAASWIYRWEGASRGIMGDRRKEGPRGATNEAKEDGCGGGGADLDKIGADGHSVVQSAPLKSVVTLGRLAGETTSGRRRGLRQKREEESGTGSR